MSTAEHITGVSRRGQWVLAGSGALAAAAPRVARAGTHALLATDAGVRESGHARRCAALLTAAGLKVSVESEIPENPTRHDARALSVATQGHGVDLVVALGGGSVIDCAKGALVELVCPGGLEELAGHVTLPHRTLPLVAVPTTAGTGSECQSAALLGDPQTHEKRAILAPGLLPAMAVLDESLPRTQPERVAVSTSIDAVAHALESAVSTAATVRSRRVALAALDLLVPHVERAIDDPHAPGSMGAVQLGAAIAGAAIEQSMLGAAHASANPLTARFGVPHGLAVGMMLPHVVRLNADVEDARRTYGEVAVRVGLAPAGASDSEAVERLLELLDRLSARARAMASRAHLEGCAGASREELSRDAARQWTGGFNPTEMGVEAYVGLYGRAFGPRADERPP